MSVKWDEPVVTFDCVYVCKGCGQAGDPDKDCPHCSQEGEPEVPLTKEEQRARDLMLGIELSRALRLMNWNGVSAETLVAMVCIGPTIADTASLEEIQSALEILERNECAERSANGLWRLIR